MKNHCSFSRRFMQALGCLAALCVLTPNASAFAQDSREEEVRAAMILNFVRFTKWPDHTSDHSNGQITICTSERNNLYAFLKKTEGRTIREMKISVIGFPYNNIHQGKCQVVVLTKEILEQEHEYRFGNALVVSTSEDGDYESASIVLVNIGRQTRFIVNPEAAKANGVEISSKLIDLAIRVR